MEATGAGQTGGEPGSRVVMAVRVVLGVGLTVALGGLFFHTGGWDWWQGWAFVGLLTAGQTANALLIRRRDPELLRRRAEFGEGTKAWDRAVLGLFGLTLLAELTVATLDAAHGWAPLPWWTWPLGAAVYLAGIGFTTWAMWVNTHFEKTVRIQTDRGHQVCDRGPYRLVRHPGYVGAALGFPVAAPLLLGSGWAFVGAVVCVATLVLRTALEDRTLRAELDGYEAFARRTRWRLLPGVW